MAFTSWDGLEGKREFFFFFPILCIGKSCLSTWPSLTLPGRGREDMVVVVGSIAAW